MGEIGVIKGVMGLGRTLGAVCGCRVCRSQHSWCVGGQWREIGVIPVLSREGALPRQERHRPQGP